MSINSADIYTLHGHVIIVDNRQFSEYTIPEAEDLACRILSAVQKLKDSNRQAAKESGSSNGAGSGTSGATAASSSRNVAPKDARKTTGGQRTK